MPRKKKKNYVDDEGVTWFTNVDPAAVPPLGFHAPELDHLCLGKCGAIVGAHTKVVGGRIKCAKCGTGACWLGRGAGERLQKEPGLLMAMRKKYA